MAKNLLPAATTVFLLILTLTTAHLDSDMVLDAEGNPLDVGSEYSIEPAIGFQGGVGRLPRSITRPCPLYAILYGNEVKRGDPLKFVPVNETQKQIHLSSDVKIDSGFSAYCRRDGFWRLILDLNIRRFVVTATGAFDNPPSLFKIEKADGSLGAYKITAAEIEESWYLTVFFDRRSGLRMLSLTDDPTKAFLFVFFKYEKDVVGSI